MGLLELPVYLAQWVIWERAVKLLTLRDQLKFDHSLNQLNHFIIRTLYNQHPYSFKQTYFLTQPTLEGKILDASANNGPDKSNLIHFSHSLAILDTFQSFMPFLSLFMSPVSPIFHIF